MPEIDATVVWYGYPPLEFVNPQAVTKPMLAHWALHDDAFAINGVDQLENMLNDAGSPIEFYRYDAKHAFANEEADARNLPYLKYHSEAATLAWERTMSFLKTQLST